MDSLRRTLVLGLPVAAVSGLHGCGGAENEAPAKATPQAVGRTSAQAEATASTTTGFTIKNRSGGNFPLASGTSFELRPQTGRIQALVNGGAPGGLGPVLALQVTSTKAIVGAMLAAELSVSVKLGPSLPTGAAVYDLALGNAQASDGLITCRQIGQDGTVTAHAFRIVAGTLVLHRLDMTNGTATVTLRDVVANAAIGFANSATGSIGLSTSVPTPLLLASENTGTQLS